MHLLPGTRRVGYKIVLNNRYFCWLRSGSCIFSNSPLKENFKHNSHNFDLGIHWRIPAIFRIGINIHTCSRQHFEYESDDISVSTKNLEIEERSEFFRSLLYPISSDTIIMQLKACDSISQVSRIMNDSSASLTSKHYCQFILVLWDLMKNYNQLPSYYVVDTVSTNIKSKINQKSNGSSNNFLETLDDNEINRNVLKALHHLSTSSESLRSDELVLSVLYLCRLGIHLKDSSIQNMLQKIYKLLTSENCNVFPLYLLSRLTLIFVDHNELWAKLFLIQTLPYIYKYFDEVSNAEEFKALTISMLSTLPYLREELLIEYEALTDELLRNGILNKDQNSIILKVVMLLNHIYYKPSARLMIYRLLQMLNGQVDKLFFPHLINLQKIVFTNLEPQFIIRELESVKKMWTAQIPSNLKIPQDLLLISLPIDQNCSLVLKGIVNQTNNLEGLLSMYSLLTTAHLDLCHMFWDKVAELLHTADNSLLTVICIRYMTFTARMGFYHHKRFESDMLSLIISELVSGCAVHHPYQFSVLAAFVLSYETKQHGATSLSVNILPRLLPMVSQLNTQSCFFLSRVFKQAMIHKRKKETLQAYLQLDSALNVRTRAFLESEENVSIDTFNNLLRICINKKETSDSNLIWDIMKRCEKLDWSELTSRSLRNLVYNFLSTSSLVPTALDHMAKYCLDNRNIIMGDTAGKLAYLCYHLGHSPVYESSFWAITADLVTRDYKDQNGLSLLQVALALSFFNHLPTSLYRLIFSVDFLGRLDEEIKNCFAKDRYPMRVRQMLMQLNRSVCLDTPEADVPWFHSKFCEEQRSLGKLDVKPKTLLFEDVYKTLSSLVGDSSLIGQNVVTPYGYTVDYQLNLDAGLNPLPFTDPENVAHKLALLLYYKDDYTLYEHKLKGYNQMKQRHLEILGYKVIGLSNTLWNAMWMTEPTAKHDYLRNIIWPS